MKQRNQNKPSLFPGRMSYEVTKSGFSCFVFIVCCRWALVSLDGVAPSRIIIIIINDNVYGAVLMTMVTARVRPVHLMNAD